MCVCIYVSMSCTCVCMRIHVHPCNTQVYLGGLISHQALYGRWIGTFSRTFIFVCALLCLCQGIAGVVPDVPLLPLLATSRLPSARFVHYAYVLTLPHGYVRTAVRVGCIQSRSCEYRSTTCLLQQPAVARVADGACTRFHFVFASYT